MDFFGMLIIGIIILICCCLGSILAIIGYKMYDKYKNKGNQDLDYYETEMDVDEPLDMFGICELVKL